MYLRWDNPSVFLYCCMGLIAVFSCHQAKIAYRNNHILNQKLHYRLWIIIWALFAGLRYVSFPVGGIDAKSYVYFFEHIYQEYMPKYYQHYDVGYWILNYAIGLFTSNYHVYFMIVYGFITFSYVCFIKEFSLDHCTVVPYFLLIFPFLLGFNTLRTTLSASFLLVSIVCLHRQKRFLFTVCWIMSIFLHKASILFALVIVFYWMEHKKKFTIKQCGLLAILGAFVAVASRELIGILLGESGAYGSYAKASIGMSFFDNFWKIAFGQLVLMVSLLALRSQLHSFREDLSDKERDKLDTLLSICRYDFILIPASFVLNIWRGYEYFYIARLAMWGVLIEIESNLFLKKRRLKNAFWNNPDGIYVEKAIFPKAKQLKNIYKTLAFGGIIIWFLFRLFNVWQDSGLLPYVFAPFI